MDYENVNFAKDILPHILSFVTLYVMYLAGKKDPSAWIIGLCNQGFWLVYTISTHTWGFLWLNICLTYIYWNNYRNWIKNPKNQ